MRGDAAMSKTLIGLTNASVMFYDRLAPSFRTRGSTFRYRRTPTMLVV